VGNYFESPEHYPALRDASILRQFNYTTGYRPDADFPVLSMILGVRRLKKTLAWPLPSFELKQRHPMMSTWISNCHIDAVGRLQLLDALAQHDVSVASYGKCGPAKTRPRTDPDLDLARQELATTGKSGDQKTAISAQHLFMYAAENSGCAYYVTEKVWHALAAGSVPVYVGDAAFLKQLVPPLSVIYAADFATPAALAEHLKHLATNQTAYKTYLAWRTNPRALDLAHRYASLPVWEKTDSRSKACALCEFLWAAPKRIHPQASMDLCQP
jgi:hypothetical protein